MRSAEEITYLSTTHEGKGGEGPDSIAIEESGKLSVRILKDEKAWR